MMRCCPTNFLCCLVIPKGGACGGGGKGAPFRKLLAACQLQHNATELGTGMQEHLVLGFGDGRL